MAKDPNTRAMALNGPASRFVMVFPNDTKDLSGGRCRGLFVGVGGSMSVVDQNGTVTEIVSADSQYHPLSVVRIRQTGTTADKIVALY